MRISPIEWRQFTLRPLSSLLEHPQYALLAAIPGAQDASLAALRTIYLDIGNDPIRAAERSAWVHNKLGEPQLALIPASADAGLRSYWRAQGTSRSWIVMDAPPQLEDVRPWLRIHALLQSSDVRVPAVFAQDLERGFLLLEDLGATALIQVLDADNADVHFDAAIEQLIRLQSLRAPADLASFGSALLQRDAGLFEQWFVAHHLGLTLDGQDLERLRQVQHQLKVNLLAQPQVPTHRDFMPRNLMPVADGPAVLDFQDLVLGPIAYDPISLFKDAFLSWPLQRVDDWLARYHARALDARLPVPALQCFLRDADYAGVQRHLKILGIFARLYYRDHKPHYLADAPRLLAFVQQVLPRHAALAPLQILLERTILPAFERTPMSATARSGTELKA